MVVQTAVAQFAEETAVVVTRYDRRATSAGKIVRVHQEDLCQALAVMPSLKYQNEGGPSPAQIVRLLRDSMPPGVAEEAVSRFADALIFNWLIGGTDAHAKNYSLLLADDQVRLAPLYDVASALPYGVHERKLRFAMKIGASYEVFPRHNSWLRAARDLGLDAEELAERARELARTTPDALADAARDPAIESLGRALPSTLLDLVADRSRRCLELLGG